MGKISEYDMYLFGTGVHYDMYMKLGAHPCKKGRWQGVNFAVWAPNAKRVWVIGSFNDWNETSHEMKRLEPNGIYELFVSNVKIGDMYKYLIEQSRSVCKLCGGASGNSIESCRYQQTEMV